MNIAVAVGDIGDGLNLDVDGLTAGIDFQDVEDIIDGEEYINYGCWKPD